MRRFDETTAKISCVSCSDDTKGGIKGCSKCLFGNIPSCFDCANGFFKVRQPGSDNVLCVPINKCDVGSAAQFNWDNFDQKSFNQTCVKCADRIKGCIECTSSVNVLQ